MARRQATYKGRSVATLPHVGHPLDPSSRCRRLAAASLPCLRVVGGEAAAISPVVHLTLEPEPPEAEVGGAGQADVRPQIRTPLNTRTFCWSHAAGRCHMPRLPATPGVPDGLCPAGQGST
jgi:hypothetical protein